MLRHSPFLGKDIRILSFCCGFVGSRGVEDGLDAESIRRGSSEKNVRTSEDVSQLFIEGKFLDNFDISATSNSSSGMAMSSIEGLWDIGSVTGAGDIGVIALKRFIGRFKPLRLGG